jgi:hypothetical protein
MPEDKWEPISVISDRPATRGTMEVFTRNLTETARIASRRQAAGVASVLDFGGPSGSAIPGILATNSPVAAFLYTISRADKLSLFRYWARHDAMVGRAIELHSELPMSRITIGPPKGPSPRQNRQITRIYESMSERLDVLGLLLEVSREYWLAGDVYCWCNWSNKLQTWDDCYVLPVEFCHSLMHPFNRKKEIIFFAKPLVDTAAVRRITDRDMYMVCFLSGTGITLRDGTQKNIEDMQEGEVVLSGDGHYEKVLAVGGRDIDEEIAIISARGLRDDLYVTLNHKLHTNRGRIPADEVQEGDFLLAAPDHSEIP